MVAAATVGGEGRRPALTDETLERFHFSFSDMGGTGVTPVRDSRAVLHRRDACATETYSIHMK
jgi:hypothetical protein